LTMSGLLIRQMAFGFTVLFWLSVLMWWLP
jgi:hypothetical protein